MKILTLDIETAPNIAHVWGLYKETISISQLREHTRVIAFAAKWHGEDEVMFYSDHHDGHEDMVFAAYGLINDADVVVHYNGRKFDMPHLRREFLLAGLRPPSPVQEIDLLEVVRGQFNFTSNKLDYVSKQLGIGQKVGHEGHGLWIRCIELDEPEAWEKMAEYNKGDVVLTEKLYDRLRPWIKGHPHHGLHTGELLSCANCGGTSLTKQGFAFTALSKFQRFKCSDCGSWCRGKNAVARVDVRGVA